MESYRAISSARANGIVVTCTSVASHWLPETGEAIVSAARQIIRAVASLCRFLMRTADYPCDALVQSMRFSDTCMVYASHPQNSEQISDQMRCKMIHELSGNVYVRN